MGKTTHDYERVTISLPSDLSKKIEQLKQDLNTSKSEIFKMAFEKLWQDYEKQKITKIAEMMSLEYETNKELTSFTSLDAEDFK